MPKRRIETQEMDAVEAAVAAFPNGASFQDVSQKLVSALNDRTLQRRLARLAKDGKIEKRGKGPRTRYHALAEGTPAEPKPWQKQDGETSDLALLLAPSPAGLEVFHAISKPYRERKPVSYQRGLLDVYRANQTFYLPAEIREELEKIGRVTNEIEPAGTYARQILDRLLIDLSYNSSRLEGNRYSLLETKQLIEVGRTAAGKAAEETQMILNHKSAIAFLVDSAETIGINRFTVQNLHAILSDNLLPDPAGSGRLRSKPVDIGGSVYRPLAVPQLVEELFLQVLGTAARIAHPFEQAFFLLVHLPYLQPFEDVNKRVSRLSANIPLIRNNLKPLSFVDVRKPDYAAGLLGVYELNRIELLRDVFVWAYKRSSEHYAAIRDSLGSPDEFKLRYREKIKAAVAHVIQSGIAPRDVAASIGAWVVENEIPAPDQARFLAVIESEITALQEWNVARYPVTLGQYRAWLAMAG